MCDMYLSDKMKEGYKSDYLRNTKEPTQKKY